MAARAICGEGELLQHSKAGASICFWRSGALLCDDNSDSYSNYCSAWAGSRGGVSGAFADRGGKSAEAKGGQRQ